MINSVCTAAVFKEVVIGKVHDGTHLTSMQLLFHFYAASLYFQLHSPYSPLTDS